MANILSKCLEDRKRALKWLNKADANKERLLPEERTNLHKYMNSITPSYSEGNNNIASARTMANNNISSLRGNPPSQIDAFPDCHESVSTFSSGPSSRYGNIMAQYSAGTG